MSRCQVYSVVMSATVNGFSFPYDEKKAMSTSLPIFEIPPQVSGALRYERVAQLEAVWSVKDSNRRARFLRVAAASIVVLSAFLIGLCW